MRRREWYGGISKAREGRDALVKKVKTLKTRLSALSLHPTDFEISTQRRSSGKVKESAESWGRAGADAAGIESLSQLSEALWAEECFLGEKSLNRPDFTL